MRLTEKDVAILRWLAHDRLHAGPGMTCRSLSEHACKNYAQWAMKSLRRLELSRFVTKAGADQFNNIKWKITDAGLERLALSRDAPAYRLLFDETAGSPPLS